MARRSAGILMWRRGEGGVEVLLVHPGGPYWRKKDAGAWSVVKGEVDEGEDEAEAARREFREETGFGVEGELVELGEVRQKGGKVVRVWAVEGDLDADAIESAEFEMEWPPRSGRRGRFPEVDRACWFGLEEGSERINAAQRWFLEELERRVGG